MDPKKVVCCGNVVRDVIAESGHKGDVTHIRLPSRTAMSRVSGMFDGDDLLERYPEVKRVAEENPSWLEGGYRQNKIFFACHAVSMAGV